MLTDEQRLSYIAGNNGQCPKCGCQQIEGDSFEYQGNRVWQKVWCTECEAEWVDTYSLSDCGTVVRDIEGETEPEMADACELRDALSQLLEIFDDLYAQGESWEDDERVKRAARIINQGLGTTPDWAQS